MKPGSLRFGILVAGLLWAAGALLLAMAGYLPLGAGWVSLLCGLAILLMTVGVVAAAAGLLPLGRLVPGLAIVRQGAADRLDGSYPEEVQPLVDDLNDLLRRNREALARSRLEADRLAHGLKTSLAILSNEIQRLEAAGSTSTEGTEEMRLQVEAMAEQVEIHLGRARTAAAQLAHPPESTCAIAPAVSRVSRVLRKLHEEKRLEIDVRVSTDLTFRGDPQDLEEMLGNLLENAGRWARTRVLIGARSRGDRVEITVEDDGLGLSAQDRAVLDRGGLPDAPRPGGGVGLKLVREAAQVYDGRLMFEESRLGGLRAVLELPSAEGTTH